MLNSDDASLYQSIKISKIRYNKIRVWTEVDELVIILVIRAHRNRFSVTEVYDRLIEM